MRNTLRLAFALLLLSPTVMRAQEPPAVRVLPEGMLLDFQDADLRLVLSALAEAAHLNLIYSELPSRRVTLRTNQPIPPEQILPLLRTLATSNGLKLTEEGSFIRLEDLGLGPRGQRATPQTDTAREAEVRLFVYRLKHARAARLGATLQSLFGGTGTRQQAAAAGSPTLSQELRQQQIAPVAPIDSGPAVRVELGPSQTPSLPGRLRSEVQIVADEVTNSLLVRAQEADWTIVRQSIETLDLRPLQVLIEVVIAEVRRSTDFQLGVSGRIGDDSSAFNAGRNAEAATLKGTSAGDFALRVMRVGKLNLDVTISALAASGRVRIISRPVLLAQNNQEARILIGSERPFVQVIRALPTDAAVRDQVVQYRDVGTQLTLTPTINDDGYVNLQISQQVSNATSEIQFGAPVISTREAATHLFVRNGQTVVIGGLVDREQERSRSGIPFLKDLPLLGGLFGSTQRSSVQSELFLFVTPHIIVDDEDIDQINESLERGADLLRPAVPKPLIQTPRDTVP